MRRSGPAKTIPPLGGLSHPDMALTLAALKARRKEVCEPLVAHHKGRVRRDADEVIRVLGLHAEIA